MNLFVLDMLGLICPLPVLRLRKRMKEWPGRTRITILATDLAAPRDIRALCDALGACYLGERSENNALTIEIISPPE